MKVIAKRTDESPEQFADRLLRRKQRVERVVQGLQAHPKRLLARILRHRDWAAHFSDDQAAWEASMEEERLIAELRAKVGDRAYDALVQKHLPCATA